MSVTFCVDFDGTCVTHEFPKIGKPIGAEKVLKRLVEHGHKLILWTMRCDHDEKTNGASPMNPDESGGQYLTDALNWFKQNGIELWEVQRNPEQDSWTSSPKAYAQVYIDDAALGCPLKYIREYSERHFVDWVEVEKILERQGYFR